MLRKGHPAPFATCLGALATADGGEGCLEPSQQVPDPRLQLSTQLFGKTTDAAGFLPLGEGHETQRAEVSSRPLRTSKVLKIYFSAEGLAPLPFRGVFWPLPSAVSGCNRQVPYLLRLWSWERVQPQQLGWSTNKYFSLGHCVPAYLPLCLHPPAASRNSVLTSWALFEKGGFASPAELLLVGTDSVFTLPRTQTAAVSRGWPELSG